LEEKIKVSNNEREI